MFKKIIVFVFAMGCFSVCGQKTAFGNVTVAELEQKKHPRDSSAVAAVIYATCDSDISYDRPGFKTRHTVTKRIKIYDKEGYRWANQQIFRNLGRRSEVVTISEASTYNLVDGKVVKTKLKTDGKFDEKINRYIGCVKFTFPNVKEGSILEFRYEITNFGVGTPPKWDFQQSIPVNYSELKTHIPDDLHFNTSQKGTFFPKVTSSKKERSGNYQETISTYILENLPGLEQEVFVENIQNYMAGISHEFAAFHRSNGVMIDSDKLASDWPSVARNIYAAEEFGGELKKRGYFEKIVDSLKTGKSSRSDIVNALFNYVKTNVKWNKQTGIACEFGLKNALKTKTGNAAEINLLLVAMLQYLEIDACPILVSTRANGIVLFPSISAFNHVIVGIETSSGTILLDATESFASPGILPLPDLNWSGRLIRSNGTSVEVNLIPEILSTELCRMAVAFNSEGVAEGRIRRQLTDYEALSFREKFRDSGKDNYLQTLESENGNIEIDDFATENEGDVSKPLSETYRFKTAASGELVNGRLYISPLLYLAEKENPFKQEKRHCPIDFGYPVQRKYNISIKIPDGFRIESVPVSAHISTGDNVGTFKYTVGNAGDKIQITAIFDMNVAVFPADYYETLKDFFQKTIDKQNEKIVLIKNQ